MFLFNFAQFVEWPQAALPRDSAPFVIGVLGKDPFGSELDDGGARREREWPPARHRALSPTWRDLRDCQILFIPAAELAHLDEILAALKGRSVLTVTDAECRRRAAS